MNSSASPLLSDPCTSGPGGIPGKPDRLTCRRGTGAGPTLNNIIVQTARSRYHPATVAVIEQSLIGTAVLTAQGGMS